MTVLSRPRRTPQPPPQAALARLRAALGAALRAALSPRAARRRERPTLPHPDPFFADPALVEDDTRRMTPPNR